MSISSNLIVIYRLHLDTKFTWGIALKFWANLILLKNKWDQSINIYTQNLDMLEELDQLIKDWEEMLSISKDYLDLEEYLDSLNSTDDPLDLQKFVMHIKLNNFSITDIQKENKHNIFSIEPIKSSSFEWIQLNIELIENLPKVWRYDYRISISSHDISGN